MNNIFVKIGAFAGVLGLVLSVVALVGGNQLVPAGGSTSDDWNVGGALAVTGASTFTGAPTFTADATFNGGNGAISVPTALSATSSITVGKVQTYATSSATAVCIGFNTQGTTSVSHAGGTAIGAVVWAYGSCL